MLRFIMGDTNFFQALRNYLNDPMLAYKYAITPQFQAHLEAVHGSSLQEFFNDWVYGKGFPTYTITASNVVTSRALTNKVVFQVNQTQSDAAVSYFEMPLPIQIVFANGSTQDVILNNTFNGQTFEVIVPENATAINFNANKDIVVSSSSTVILGVSEYELSKQVNLFPNPSKDIITIELPNLVTLEKVSFINSLGQKILIANTDKINVSRLSTGNYQVLN